MKYFSLLFITFLIIMGCSGNYGNFTSQAGNESKEIEIEELDRVKNETILSGDIGTEDDLSDNCYSVVTGANGTMINGFTITKGNSDILGDRKSVV